VGTTVCLQHPVCCSSTRLGPSLGRGILHCKRHVAQAFVHLTRLHSSVCCRSAATDAAVLHAFESCSATTVRRMWSAPVTVTVPFLSRPHLRVTSQMVTPALHSRLRARRLLLHHQLCRTTWVTTPRPGPEYTDDESLDCVVACCVGPLHLSLLEDQCHGVYGDRYITRPTSTYPPTGKVAPRWVWHKPTSAQTPRGRHITSTHAY
jgi:hypothetical protein